MAKLEKLYEIIDKENFEPGGTLEEWIEVDAGAIVMLCGQYTDKKEPAKTEVSFVRKLNEVT